MIVVRFFTGVSVYYEAANLFTTLPDGRIEIIKHNAETDERIVIAVIQTTAGAIVERGDIGMVSMFVQKINNSNRY